MIAIRRSIIAVTCTATFCLIAVPAMAQHLGQGADDGVSIWRLVAAVVIILVLGGAALFLAKSRSVGLKLWAPASSRRIRVIEVARLSPQALLCLAACDDKEYLIAVTAGSATVIETRHPDESAA